MGPDGNTDVWAVGTNGNLYVSLWPDNFYSFGQDVGGECYYTPDAFYYYDSSDGNWWVAIDCVGTNLGDWQQYDIVDGNGYVIDWGLWNQVGSGYNFGGGPAIYGGGYVFGTDYNSAQMLVYDPGVGWLPEYGIYALGHLSFNGSDRIAYGDSTTSPQTYTYLRISDGSVHPFPGSECVGGVGISRAIDTNGHNVYACEAPATNMWVWGTGPQGNDWYNTGGEAYDNTGVTVVGY
jgi:hypothetical protein